VTLGVLELERDRVAPDEIVQGVPGYPFLQMRAGDYFDAIDDHGSPAATPEEIAAAPEKARLEADAQLVRLHPELTDGAAVASGPRALPAVDGATGRAATGGDDGCIVFRPDAVRSTLEPAALELTLPAGGVLVEAQRGPAAITLRRFAAGYAEDTQAQLAGGGVATISPRGDRLGRPWHLRIEPDGPVKACGLGPAS